jgi:carbon monoxide dehydrogenase subunit G
VRIKTNTQTINASQEVIFNFLMDMNNFKTLFPQDKISEWQANNKECSMKVKNMGILGLKRVNSTPNSSINIDSHGKVPFTFTLNLFLKESESKLCEFHLEFDGKVNPFMKVMVEKPLNDFFESLTKKVASTFQ